MLVFSVFIGGDARATETYKFPWKWAVCLPAITPAPHKPHGTTAATTTQTTPHPHPLSYLKHFERNLHELKRGKHLPHNTTADRRQFYNI